MLQQVDFVRHLLFFEITDRVFLGPALLFKNKIQFSQPAHLVLNSDDILTVQFNAGQADKHAVADGIFDPDPLIRIKVAKGEQHHKTQGALIDPAAFLVFQRQGRQGAVLTEYVVQFAYDAAGLGRQGASGESVKRFQAIHDGFAFREFFFVVH